MTELQKLYEKYRNVSWKKYGQEINVELRESLQRIGRSEIHSIDDAKQYLELLRNFRTALEANLGMHGRNFLDMIQSLLSVGTDGLYTDKLRFLYELIQNVDDCEYEDINDCRLEVKFDFNTDQIELEYNELGFSPFNVFAITGIAEAAKNIDEGKIEIGEKGIGFKSVFGIAHKVLIQSGYFSFSLYRGHFTIPESAFEGYDKPVKGTKMTIYLNQGEVSKIYRSISSGFNKDKSILTKNPILFLNKLTHLRLYNDKSWRSLTFDITREPIDYDKGLQVEHNVKVAIDVRTPDEKFQREIMCHRYTLPVIYDEDTCKSRYGDKTELKKKTMYVQALVPAEDEVKKVSKGIMYSFLPTKIKLDIPAVIHAPFKLVASREFVDDQLHNAWFSHTCYVLKDMLSGMYKDLAKTVKENIIYYLPDKDGSIFARDSDGRVWNLYDNFVFKGSHFLRLPVFHTKDNQYLSCRDVISLPAGANQKICNVLKVYNSWFVPPADYTNENLKRVGIEIKKDLADSLLKAALENEQYAEDCFNYLYSGDYYDKINLKNIDMKSITMKQVEFMFKYPDILNLFNKNSGARLRSRKQPLLSIKDIGNKNLREVLRHNLDVVPNKVETYLKSVECIYDVLKGDKGSCLIASNGLVLAENYEIDAFINVCDSIAPDSSFGIMMKAKQFSEKLNLLDEDNTISDSEYLRELRAVRTLQMDTMDKQKMYKNYISILLQSGNDTSRFLNELLQNADDCVYPEGSVPTFSLEYKNNRITTKCNEVGFKRSNVRALTAIGESTKGVLYSNDKRATIGHKGVGFKSVFGIADTVFVSSGVFNFKLTIDTPTIPEEISVDNNFSGTKMDFVIKKDAPNVLAASSLTTGKIISLCLCLRKLKNIKLMDYEISIVDEGNFRKITVNDKEYCFRKYEHAFCVPAEILEKGNTPNQEFSGHQVITCFAAFDKETKAVAPKGHIYCGLPTLEVINTPISIDGPFKLTTSREHLLWDSWNNCVIFCMNDAFIKCLLSMREELQDDVLSYISFQEINRGNRREYDLNVFASHNLNDTLFFLDSLRSAEILPTKEKGTYVAAKSKAERYPNVVEILIQLGVDLNNKNTVLDVGQDKNTVVINGLGVKNADFQKVFDIVKPHINANISDKKFRDSFYTWLRNTKLTDEQKKLLSTYNVIPVYDSTGNNTLYVSGSFGTICYSDKKIDLPPGCYLLNENWLKQEELLKFFGVSAIDPGTILGPLYLDGLQKEIDSCNKSSDELYAYILNEFNRGLIDKYGARGIVCGAWNQGRLKLKNRKDNITENAKVINGEKSGYFTDIVDEISVNDECIGLARALGIPMLCEIHYSDIPKELKRQLEADDIETFQDDYFNHGNDILDGFWAEGYISRELALLYGIIAQPKISSDPKDDGHDFPTDKLDNVGRLKEKIKEYFAKAGVIVKEQVTLTVDKVRYSDGSKTDLPVAEARFKAMSRYGHYSGVNDEHICYCQMCKMPKFFQNIEVNNIEKKPDKFLPEMRVALCLECSKTFEHYRNNDIVHSEFLADILNANLSGGYVDVPYAKTSSIRFTTKHLAEIQELLRLKENEKS